MNNSVSVLFGANSIKKVYEDSLKDESLDIICLASNYKAVIGDFFDRIYGPKLYGKIKTREIISDNLENREDAKAKDQHINAVKFLAGTSETDMLLSADKAVLISYNRESPLAVVISDPELVKSLKLEFEVLWGGL